MKETGIVRRIDELGRVVIPKELRRTMGIRNGEPLEIFTDNGMLILRKYSSLKNFEQLAANYSLAVNRALGVTVIIFDRDTVIAADGEGKKTYINQLITDKIKTKLEERKQIFMDERTSISPIEDANWHPVPEVLIPIIHEGEICGGILALLSKNENEQLVMKLLECGVDFISQQL